jgi:hypothetical protein
MRKLQTSRLTASLGSLTNDPNNMQKLTANYLRMAASMNYISPVSLDNDPFDQKTHHWAHSLAPMAAANQFVQDSSCQ